MPRICTIAAVVVLFAACRQAGPPAISPAVAFEKARIRLEPLFNMVDSFSAEGLARVSSFTDSSTYIDSNGKQLIAYKYNVQPFYEGLGLVEESETGPFYYIDKAGKKVVELPGYTNAFSFHGGYAAVANKDGLYGLIDKTGKEVIPCIYEESPGMVKTGIYAVSPARKPKVLISVNGTALPAIKDFNELYYDSIHNTYAVRNNGGWFLLDDKGAIIKKIDADGVIANPFGVYILSKTPGGKSTQRAVMDGAGNMVVPYGKYDNIENFAEGFACVGVETGASPDKDEPGISTVHQKIGYIDVTGKEVIPLQFEDIMPSFSEGFVQAMQHEKIGYIDRTGKWVIQPRFDKAQPFSHGFAKVIAGGSSYYIDTKGNKIQ